MFTNSIIFFKTADFPGLNADYFATYFCAEIGIAKSISRHFHKNTAHLSSIWNKQLRGLSDKIGLPAYTH